ARPHARVSRVRRGGLAGGRSPRVVREPAVPPGPSRRRYRRPAAGSDPRGANPPADIAAPRGERIVPIRSGRVVFAGWKSNCGGYQVWVSHGDGLYSAYYHMVRESSSRGEWVTGGRETLGWVGASGCATGPHLHIEVWKGYPWHSGSYRGNPWGVIDNGAYLPYRSRC